MRKAVCALGLLIATVSPAAYAGDTAKQPDGLSRDTRLTRTVRIQRSRAFLGELMPLLSKQAGVRLTVSTNRGPVDGIELTVFVKDLPAREVMESLRGVLSTRFNQWEWQAKPDGSGYTLICQRSPEVASAAAQQELRARFARDVRTVYDTVRLPEPARSARAKLNPELWATGELERATLLAALDLGQLDQLFKGQEVPLDPSRLSDAQMEALRLRMSGAEPDPERRPAFYVRWNRDNLGPTLQIRNEAGIETHVVGGTPWDSAALKDYSPGWISAVDTEPQALLAQRARDPSVGAETPDRTYPALLKRASETQGLNVIADLVYARGNGTTWMGRTPAQTVLELVASGLIARMDKKIWLIRDPTALVHPRLHLVSWTERRALREAADKNAGFLGLNELTRLVDLSDEQLKALAEEFPDAAGGGVMAWRPLLRFHRDLSDDMRARIRKPAGVPLRDTGLVARASLAAGPDRINLLGLDFLEANLKTAIVSFRYETLPAGPRPLMPSVPGVVWSIKVSGFPERLREWRLQPRKPLEPEESAKKLPAVH